MGQIDPELPLKIAPMDGRYALESGLRLKASVAPRHEVATLQPARLDRLYWRSPQLIALRIAGHAALACAQKGCLCLRFGHILTELTPGSGRGTRLSK